MIELFDYLIENNITVSTAESCTGGNISAEFVAYPGISKIFVAGLCTYHNNAKENILGVKSETLKNFGAVSEQCAREMLLGLKERTGAEACVCTTGIAGPGGGTPQKPVGLVYIGASFREKTEIVKCNFSGSRSDVINQAKDFALNLLYKIITEGNKNG